MNMYCDYIITYRRDVRCEGHNERKTKKRVNKQKERER